MFSWKKVLLISFLVIHIGACGKPVGKSKQIEASPASATNPTKDDSPQKVYTSFSPRNEHQQMQDQVPANDENKAFARTIEKASLTSKIDHPEEVEIKLKLANFSEPVSFQGTLKKDGEIYIGELIETDGQNSGLTITASSASPLFTAVTAIITDNAKRKAGVIIRQEDRTLKIKMPTSEEGLPNEDAETKKILDQYGNGKDVVVTSTEIYPFKSYYEVRGKSGTLTGELLETNGEELESSAEGDLAKIGKPVLVGNTEDGDGLVWKMNADKPDAPTPIFGVLEPRKIPEPTQNPLAIETCGIQMAGKNVNAYVKQILSDCNNPLVIQYMKSFWLSPHNGEKKLEHFLTLNEVSNTKNPGGEGLQFKTMLDVLKKQSYPSILGLITIMESDFRAKAAPPTGSAYGWWQFLESTAVNFGLSLSPLDQRTEIVPSTYAATKYFDKLLAMFKGDLKMSIASYNYGEGNMLKTAKDAGKNYKLNADFSNDFWVLVQYRMIDAETKDYVLKFLSGAIISFNPQIHGMSYRAVELN